jgi:hypothetical protein
MNLDDPHRLEHMPPGIGAGNNLIDSLGADGGIVLPFSYTSPGATLEQANSFTFPGYTAQDVATTDPISIQPSNLENEIRSVHRALPNAKIFVVGHSNGGLIAEQWWWKFGRHNHEGVVQVISLDAPLNGVYDSAYCYLIGALNGARGFKAPCGKALADAYGFLWKFQNVLDPLEIAADNTDKLFTAVGTYGDPLFDMSDNNATTIPTDARIGIISQLFYTEPSCDSGINKFDLNTDRCQPAGRYFIDPCSSKGVPLDHQWGPPGIPPGYGAPGSIWMHSVVKNCSGVIKEVLSFYPQTTTKPTASPSTTTAPVQATVVKKFEPWVAVGQMGAATPAPGLVVTNAGTAACDSGSADDPGSALAVRCTPPGNGIPCFINDTGGGDPGSPLLCSSDPTSMQLTEVTPAGQNGIPAAMLNHGGPSLPAWFLILADGRKCHLLGYGTNTNVLSYDCGGTIGATVPDRSQPTWTVHEGTLQASPTPSSATVAVLTAYR